MQLLRISPEKVLEFAQTKNSVRILRLENTQSSNVAFKIKTTAPKSYVVRPSTGLIPALASQDIQISVQRTETTPSGDRFLVQASLIDSDALPADFWGTVDKSKVQDHRLNVSFTSPSGDDAAPPGAALSGRGFGTGVSDVGVSRGSGPGLAASGRLMGTATGGAAATGAGAGDANTETSKYQELVNYCLAVERQKSALQKENEKMKAQLSSSAAAKGGSVAAGGAMICPHCGAEGQSLRKSGLELWSVAAVVVILLVLLQVFKFVW